MTRDPNGYVEVDWPELIAFAQKHCEEGDCAISLINRNNTVALIAAQWRKGKLFEEYVDRVIEIKSDNDVANLFAELTVFIQEVESVGFRTHVDFSPFESLAREHSCPQQWIESLSDCVVGLHYGTIKPLFNDRNSITFDE